MCIVLLKQSEFLETHIHVSSSHSLLMYLPRHGLWVAPDAPGPALANAAILDQARTDRDERLANLVWQNTNRLSTRLRSSACCMMLDAGDGTQRALNAEDREANARFVGV